VWYQDAPSGRDHSRYDEWFCRDYRMGGDVPIAKPCDYCGKTVEKAYLCDRCADGWLRTVEGDVKTGTWLMLINGYHNKIQPKFSGFAAESNKKEKLRKGKKAAALKEIL
jgi:hypothetical protein